MLPLRVSGYLGKDSNKGIPNIPQSFSITEVSPSDCLVSYPGHSLGESYPSAEMQSVYSTAPADWATGVVWFLYIQAYHKHINLHELFNAKTNQVEEQFNLHRERMRGFIPLPSNLSESERPVSWSGRIHRLHPCGEVTPSTIDYLGHDTKPCDGETPPLELWEKWNTPSFPLLPGPLWPGVAIPEKVTSIVQIELFNYLLLIC